MLKKTISWLVMSIVMIFAFVFPTKTALADTLSGIPNQYSEEVNYLIDQGALVGYPDGSFGANDSVTRQQAATMIARAFDLSGDKRSTVFPDVSSSSYASGYIQSAYEAGFITGYPDGTYRPHQTMTRGEMAYLIAKAFSLTKESGIYYSDVSGSGSQYEAINRVSTAGIANGFPDGTYRPDKTLTRLGFSLLVARGLNPDYRVEKELSPIGEQVVTAGPLNVRTGPSTNYQAISQLQEGSVIKVYKQEGDWLLISYGNLQGYVHGAYTAQKASSSRIIAIDAGHGGYDGGATGNGLVEKEINLDVAKRVRNYLEDSGIQVVMTRSDDTFISLDGRVSYAVNHNADTFVSIHSNAFPPDESANGVETYYSSSALSPRANDSLHLARFIQERLVDAMQANDRGVKDAPFRVIDDTPLPSALVELGFVTNDGDASKLGSSYWRDRAAKAIYRGILDYYDWKD